MKKVALGSDHAGFKMKEAIKNHLKSRGYEIVDFGTDSENAVDYPDHCRPAAESVAKGESNCGIVFGGSGNGEECGNVRQRELKAEVGCGRRK